MSVTEWECVLPLRPNHVLSPEAARELAEQLRPRPGGHYVPVYIGTSGDSAGRPESCGTVQGAEVLDLPEAVGVKVKARIWLDDGDLGRSALELLRSQTAGVGMEGSVMAPPGTRLRADADGENVLITSLLRVDSLNIVPVIP